MAPFQSSGISLDQVETIISRNNIDILTGNHFFPLLSTRDPLRGLDSALQSLAHNLLCHCESTDTPADLVILIEYSTIPGRPIIRSRSYHLDSKGVPRAVPTISLLDLDDQVPYSISTVILLVDMDGG